MITLGIETASAVCSIGIVNEEEKILGEVSLHVPFLHAEWIFPRIDQLLRDLDLKPGDLGGIAVSIGPGSFTGLRVGLSAAKGIACSLQCPLTTVETLDMIAYQSTGICSVIWAVIPSIRGEFFACSYERRGNKVVRIGESRLYAPEDFFAFLGPGNLIIGVIPPALEKSIIERFHETVALYSWEGLFRGAIIALLGARKINDGKTSDVASIEPLYLRSFPDKKGAAV